MFCIVLGPLMMCVSQNDSSSRVNVFFRSLVTRALRCVESHEHRVSATAADLSWLSNGCSLCLVPCLPSISFCFTTLSPLSSSLCPYSLVLSSYFLHGFLFPSLPAPSIEASSICHSLPPSGSHLAIQHSLPYIHHSLYHFP